MEPSHAHDVARLHQGRPVRDRVRAGAGIDDPIGGNGQLWQLLYSHGAVGTAGYLGFFAYGLWRFRRDRTAIGVAGSAALVSSFSAMLWYNSLVTPLAFMVLAVALLWRNSMEGDPT